MPKDISQYMDFEKNDGRFPKRSIRSLFNLPAIIHSWQIYDSKFRDGNPSGKFIQMQVELESGNFLVNTGSAIIMEQLEAVKTAKEQAGETDMSFTCLVKRYGRGVKMFPLDWDRKDVSTQERTQGEQDGCADESL